LRFGGLARAFGFPDVIQNGSGPQPRDDPGLNHMSSCFNLFDRYTNDK
jgi:hypothetical protein